MAAIITTIIEELSALIESGGLTGALARGAVTGAAAFGVGDLINFLSGKASSGDPQRDARARHKAPRYALVDLKKDSVLLFMGPRRAYRILLRPRRRASRTKIIHEVERVR